ncbi:MAG: hypothetical protein WCP29_09955 [Acidobacteriota bacterium]
MTHPPERDWMIVAPWWQWTPPGSLPAHVPVTPEPARGRVSKPVFQKYDSPRLVNDFIADPQRCLTFVTDDLVHALQPAPEPSTNKAGKFFRLSAAVQRDGTRVDRQYVPDGTETRKIFLDTHKRFYLVVCDIRCDATGFPKAARDKICKAGFVVRRRTTTPPSESVAEVKPILGRLSAGRAQLARVNQLTDLEHAARQASTGADAGAPGGASMSDAKLQSLLNARTSLRNLVAEEKGRFDAWVKRFGVVPQLHGWFPSPQGFSKVGAWAPVDEMPAERGAESSFPLYPLIPDKNDPTHAGHFGSIYFGVLPTSSHDTDERGRARFDDQEFYEVRCWVQRHRASHDADQPCRCPDGLFWSLPTRPYKRASQFDLTGTSHQPVTIQLPDLNVLAAQAKPSLGVGLAKPKGSLMVTADKGGKPQNKGLTGVPEICFFPIPLITIVATFVFELFLPVVMLLFQLWWMLALKFCIPPEIGLSAGITAEIGSSGNIGISADLDVDATIEAHIDADVRARLDAAVGVSGRTDLLAQYSSIAVANADIGATGAAGSAGAGGGVPAHPPSVVANLEYEPEVVHA